VHGKETTTRLQCEIIHQVCWGSAVARCDIYQCQDRFCVTFISSCCSCVHVQASSLHMVGAKYQWILAGKYADDWWRVAQESVTAAEAEDEREGESADDDDEHRCSEKTLHSALNGYICADILVLSLLQQPTIADLVRCMSLRHSSRCR